MQKTLKIAVILPAAYSGGTMRGALNAAIQIHDGSRAVGEPACVRFGFVDNGQSDIHLGGFHELKRRGIIPEPIRTEYVNNNQYFDKLHGGFESRYVIFNNGIDNFDTVDFIIIVSDRVPGIVAPSYRFGMIVYDFIQRYIPGILDTESDSQTAANWLTTINFMRNYVGASAVFVTTEQTRNDAIGYGGVESKKVILLPSEFDPLPDPVVSLRAELASDPFILWTTNSTQHKNHVKALEALKLIYRQQPDFPIVVMTGVHTDLFQKKSPYAYCNEVGELIERDAQLKQKIRILGNVPDEEYVSILSHAELLFHPALFDNGTFSVLEAAWHGVPSVSARYPAMEEISRRFLLPLTFFDPFEAEKIASALKGAFGEQKKLKADVPERLSLERFSPQNNAVGYWSAISRVVTHSIKN